MMDGGCGHQRCAGRGGHTEVGILSLRGQVRVCLLRTLPRGARSAPKSGDKKTYQMDPANVRKRCAKCSWTRRGRRLGHGQAGAALRDVIRAVRESTTLPVAAYHVSGEYAMLRAAAERGGFEYEPCLLECLLSLRRAGAEIIFTYGALDAARALATERS